MDFFLIYFTDLGFYSIGYEFFVFDDYYIFRICFSYWIYSCFLNVYRRKRRRGKGKKKYGRKEERERGREEGRKEERKEVRGMFFFI